MYSKPMWKIQNSQNKKEKRYLANSVGKHSQIKNYVGFAYKHALILLVFAHFGLNQRQTLWVIYQCYKKDEVVLRLEENLILKKKCSDYG